jgi:hypothetical protein
VKLSLSLLLLTVPVLAVANTLTFDEFGTGSLVDVNALHAQGVLLGFTSGQATYNGMIGTSGNAVLSIDPVLMGPTTGTLTFAFDVPTAILEFDIILQSIFTIDDSSVGMNGGAAYTVLLSTGTIQTGGTAPQPDGFYSEGHFQYSGQPITSAAITFFNGTDAGAMPVEAFGIDNFTFNSPEPGTNLFIGAGFIILGTWKRFSGRRR